jgi:hypothetical protein
LVIVAAITPTIAAGLTLATLSPALAPTTIAVGPSCTVQPVSPNDALASTPLATTQRVACGGLPMDISWEAFSPRITAAPLMAERRRLVARAETEGLQENWLQTADGTPGTWRIMVSNEPWFAIGVSMWVDGRPIRPGLVMRAKMAMNSLIGSAFAPMVVTVTPAVDWASLNPAEAAAAAESVPAFLRLHPDLNPTVGALSAH